MALLANTEYVCIFDDDTIPGKRWFENYLSTIKQYNGLLGTVDVLFKKLHQIIHTTLCFVQEKILLFHMYCKNMVLILMCHHTPPEQYDLYGSIPITAWSYGNDKNAATWLLPNQFDYFTKCYQYFRNLGFKIILEK
jgi:hypothetical protein